MAVFFWANVLALACAPVHAFLRMPSVLVGPARGGLVSQFIPRSRLNRALASMPTYGAFGDGDECASDNIFPPKEPNPLQLRMEAAKKEMLSPAGDNVTPKSLDELEGVPRTPTAILHTTSQRKRIRQQLKSICSRSHWLESKR